MEFCKFNLEKFSNMLGSLGTETAIQGEHMHKTAKTIDPSGDIQKFISNNQSITCNIAKEEFQQYDPVEMSAKFKNQDSKMKDLDLVDLGKQRNSSSEVIVHSDFSIINDNYIQIGPNQTIEAGTKKKEQPRPSLSKKGSSTFELINKKETLEHDT